MDGDKKFLVEKLAEYAERNRFTLEELEGLIRLCLQLERDYPRVKFVIHEGNALSVARDLRRQAHISKRPEISEEEFSNKFNQAWA